MAQSEKENWNEIPAEQLCNRLSSEFRGPLNMILNSAEYVEATLGGQKEERTEKALRSICKNALFLDRLSGNLLDLLLLTRGECKPALRPLDLVDQVAGLLDSVQPYAQRQGVTLRLEEPSVPAIMVRGDEVLLDRIMLALLSNVLLYVPQGGEAVLTLQTGKEGARLTMQDNGPGIEEEKMAHLFEPFGGSALQFGQPCSLGFYLAKQFCQAQGWDLQVHSGSEGTRVSLRFPPMTVSDAAQDTLHSDAGWAYQLQIERRQRVERELGGLLGSLPAL